MKRELMTLSVKTLLLTAAAVMVGGCQQVPQMQANNEFDLMTVSLADKQLSSRYTASIQGRQDVEVRPQVSGVITEVCIAEGATVKQGQTLFIIDQVPYKAALQVAMANVEAAEANVASAQLTADSKKELFDENVVSNYDLQTAQNTLRAQRAALSQAKAQEISVRNDLSYTVVKSPSDGVASMIPYRVGALVSSSITAPLVTVSEDKEMYAYFSMTENQVLSVARQSGSLGNALKAMPEVQLSMSDGTLYAEKGKIDAISGLIDPATGAISVRAVFPNPNRVLRSGGSGNIVFPYEKQQCIVVPQTATYEIQDRIFVYKVEDGKAKSTPVTVFEVNNGTEYIVESGLKPGDVIVAEGAGLLRDGAEVTPKRAKVAEVK